VDLRSPPSGEAYLSLIDLFPGNPYTFGNPTYPVHKLSRAVPSGLARPERWERGRARAESGAPSAPAEWPLRRNVILYGPPGTGKTYSCAAFAVAAIEAKRPAELQKALREAPDSVLERYRR
jgi:Cdc6-like AAA superfamily ATPase